MTEKTAYLLSAIYNAQNELADICCTNNNRKFHVLGNGGIEREHKIIEAFLKKLPESKKSSPENMPIPVFLGIGMGHAIFKLLSQYNSHIVIIDKEQNILEFTQIAKKLNATPQQVLYIDSDNPHRALAKLNTWQLNFDISPPPQLIPILHPFYARLDRNYYSFLCEEIKKMQKTTFWEHAISPRFVSNKAKLLLISSKYFLMGEVIEACKSLNIEYEQIVLESDKIASNVFIEQLLSKVVKFKPDAVVTINHSGIDQEGILMHLLDKLQLPLASWFVDNPHLILHLYTNTVSPWASIFTWDADNIASLKKELAFEHIFYLPLATNPQRFKPISTANLPKQYFSDISFVANSMYHKINARIEMVKPCKILLDALPRMARDFDASTEKSLRNFLLSQSPEIVKAYHNIECSEKQLAYETALTWEATKQYRTKCVEQLMPFNPLIVGEDGWHILLKDYIHKYKYHPVLSYYTELPQFYPCSTINFNCTSKQMKGSVNQRIFDVPATNSFVLTDWREQMDDLFEPKKEVIFFKDMAEIPELVRYYLKNEKERIKIVQAARKRILAEHTWAHRLQTLLQHMKNIYGISKL